MNKLWGVHAERKTTATSFVCLGRAVAVAAHRDTQPCEQGAQALCPSPVWGAGKVGCSASMMPVGLPGGRRGKMRTEDCFCPVHSLGEQTVLRRPG